MQGGRSLLNTHGVVVVVGMPEGLLHGVVNMCGMEARV